jgi:signal transduction histidine kinase/CheY-like chemotaxis protein
MIISESSHRHAVLAVIGLTTVCILGIALGLAAELLVLRDRALKFASQAATHLTMVSVDYLENTLEAADRVLRDAVYHARTNSTGPHPYFAGNSVTAGESADELIMVDADGIFTTPARLPPGLADAPFFARHRDFAGARLVTTARTTEGSMHLLVSRRLETASGAFSGVAAIAIPLTRFDRILTGGESTNKGAIYLPTGERVAPADDSSFPPQWLSAAEFAQEDAPHRRHLADGHLIVGSFIDEDEVLKWWRRDAFLIMPVASLLILILGVGAALLVASINRNFRQQNDRLNAVQSINSELEHLVGERTKELQVARSSAEKASNTKSRFLAAAAHDLRQPLQALMMFLDELGYRPLAAAEQAILHKIETSAQSLSNLLNGLLDIGAIDSGSVEPRLTNVSLTHIFDGIEAKFHAPAAAKGLALTIVPTGVSVHSDPVLLSRILSNLVSNAVRYSETGRILVGVRRRGAEILIQVADSGIGIAPEQLPLVFEEYYQVANVGRDHRRGTGLGLAIVERLTALLGHKLDVRSRLGHGSIFTIRLPLATGTRSDDDCSQAEPVSDGKGALVVVVDDDPDVRQSIERALKNRRYTVLPAGSSREALELTRWAGRPPVAIVADYRLSGSETGISVITAIRALNPEAHSVAIILTGEQSLDQAMPEDVTLLRKPIAPTVLCATIERLRRSSAPEDNG